MQSLLIKLLLKVVKKQKHQFCLFQSPKLGDILVPELIKETGSGDKVLAYGKAGVVGVKGEIEHASAFIHTLRFGNKFRDAVGGTSYLSFTNTRGPAGCKISIPMMHKTDSGLRPYYLTHESAHPQEEELMQELEIDIKI